MRNVKGGQCHMDRAATHSPINLILIPDNYYSWQVALLGSLFSKLAQQGFTARVCSLTLYPIKSSSYLVMPVMNGGAPRACLLTGPPLPVSASTERTDTAYCLMHTSDGALLASAANSDYTDSTFDFFAAAVNQGGICVVGGWPRPNVSSSSWHCCNI